MNKVMLLGRICNDLEVKYTKENKAYIKFSLAVPHRTKDRGVDFISCLAWDKHAEFLQKYMQKGSQIAISGRIQTGQYDDNDGKRIYTTDVIVEEVDFAESKKESTTSQELGSNQSTTSQSITDEDLPF